MSFTFFPWIYSLPRRPSFHIIPFKRNAEAYVQFSMASQKAHVSKAKQSQYNCKNISLTT